VICVEYELNDQYLIWLSGISGITARKFHMLLSNLGDARAIWQEPELAKPFLDEKTYKNLISARNEENFFRLFYMLEKDGITAIPFSSAHYPARLTDIYDPPAVLYVRGDTNLDFEKAFSVVGTRTPSFDGRKTASAFTQTLAENGVTVISGLARGVDTIAHESCLNAGGKTIAVLGSGLNRMYPPENAELAERILAAGGALVSEMLPDEGPQKWSFPMRNRIIAGLSEGVLIVEGRKTSGAMITAACALDASREVYAVPGSIYASLSEGPNHLIQNGAFPALSPWDILEAQRWGTRPGEAKKAKPDVDLNENEKSIVEKLKIQPLSFDEISKMTQFSTQELNSLLTMLILRGIIIKTPGNSYRLN